nr:uncharacterized protein LOC107441960 isoform X2 [Parasteatoda tepidariorum]
MNEVEEKNILNEEKNLYYLPQQTVFGQPRSLIEIDASKTSPPSIMIKPSTTLRMKESEPPTKDFTGGRAYSSFCTSEVSSKEVLNSELLPSRDISKESVVLSGYMETPSKTSDDHHHHMLEKSRLVSISSDDKLLIGSAF